MASGGTRPGAGRKPYGEIQFLRRRLDALVTADGWDAILLRLLESALQGNAHAAQLLLTYRFGIPLVQTIPDMPVTWKELDQMLASLTLE